MYLGLDLGTSGIKALLVKENNSNGLLVKGVAVIINNLHDSAPDFL